MVRRRRALPPHVVEDVARATGQVRLYYRPPKDPDQPEAKRRKIRIYPGVHQEGFWPAYEAAKRGEQLPKPKPPGKPKPSRVKTFETLCREYFLSANLARLSPVTQRTRRNILLQCCAEETKVGSGYRIGDTPIAEFGLKHVKALRDRKGELSEAANNRVKAIRGLFAWHQEGDESARNPCAGLKKLKPKNVSGFHSWTLEEVEQFEAKHPIGTTARLAFDLALYTAQRKSDVVRLGPIHTTIVDQTAWLAFQQLKTKRDVELPIIEPLAESIAARPIDGPTFLMTSFGKSYTANGLGNAFREWADDAGLPQCTMHGLRKATAARLAELGISEDGIGAVTGHSSGKELARYTKAARRKLLAADAMQRLAASLKKPQMSHSKTDAQENGTFAEENRCE